MNFDLLIEYFGLLRDPSVPSNRVVRKVAVLTAVVVCSLVAYRHIALGFGLWEPALVTLGLAFLIAAVLGIFGGLGAGALYEAFLRKTGAQNREPSWVVFLVEWLFALAAPFIGLIIYALVAGSDGRL